MAVDSWRRLLLAKIDVRNITPHGSEIGATMSESEMNNAGMPIRLAISDAVRAARACTYASFGKISKSEVSIVAGDAQRLRSEAFIRA